MASWHRNIEIDRAKPVRFVFDDSAACLKRRVSQAGMNRLKNRVAVHSIDQHVILGLQRNAIAAAFKAKIRHSCAAAREPARPKAFRQSARSNAVSPRCL